MSSFAAQAARFTRAQTNFQNDAMSHERSKIAITIMSNSSSNSGMTSSAYSSGGHRGSHEQKGPFVHKQAKEGHHPSGSDEAESNSLKTIRFKDLWNNYPKEASISDLSVLVGGDFPDVLSKKTHAVDISAVRLSRAISKSGHELAEVSDAYTGALFKDKEGNVLILTTFSMASLLTKKLGKPRSAKDQTHILGRQGIVLLDNIKGGTIKSHVDLWNGKGTGSLEDYWHDAGEISFWELA